MPPKSPNSAEVWESLNERQQTYLKLIYQVDQETETYEKGCWNRGQRSQPASEWRWLRYGETAHGPTPLKRLILNAGLVDQGTGSTFKALEVRKLIETRVWFNPYARLVDVSGCNVEVYMQPLGRKIVRQALGIKPKKKLPSGTLRDYQWEALAECYKAGFWGLSQYNDEGHRYWGRASYGGIEWNTWLRLRDYKQGDLVEEYGRYKYLGAKRYVENWIRLTPFGEAFYQENWTKYQELYSDVEAIAPREPMQNPPDPIPDEDLAYWVRRCRGPKGRKEVATQIILSYGLNITSRMIEELEEGFLPEEGIAQILNQWIMESFSSLD